MRCIVTGRGPLVCVFLQRVHTWLFIGATPDECCIISPCHRPHTCASCSRARTVVCQVQLALPILEANPQVYLLGPKGPSYVGKAMLVPPPPHPLRFLCPHDTPRAQPLPSLRILPTTTTTAHTLNQQHTRSAHCSCAVCGARGAFTLGLSLPPPFSGSGCFARRCPSLQAASSCWSRVKCT